jgi:hypothetical protein
MCNNYPSDVVKMFKYPTATKNKTEVVCSFFYFNFSYVIFSTFERRREQARGEIRNKQ